MGAQGAAALLILLVAGAGGLKNVKITVPEAVASGSTVTLYCRYELETDSLYSVKWYNGVREFFRYIPKELPHTKIFPMPGVTVDVGRSGPTSVVLRNVTPSSSGRYRCEVSADAPSFHTIMHSSNLQVVDLPSEPPVVEAERTRVAAGDTLTAKCIAPPTDPAANLTWYLNGQLVNGTRFEVKPAKVWIKKEIVPTISPFLHYYYTTPKSEDDNELGSKKDEPQMVEVTRWSRVSTLTIVVKEDTLREGTLRLMCKTTIYSLYTANKELSLAAEKPQTASILVLATGHTDSGSYLQRDKIVLLLVLILNVILR